MSAFVQEYRGEDYDLFSRNCCHFADDFVRTGALQHACFLGDREAVLLVGGGLGLTEFQAPPRSLLQRSLVPTNSLQNSTGWVSLRLAACAVAASASSASSCCSSCLPSDHRGGNWRLYGISQGHVEETVASSCTPALPHSQLLLSRV